MASGSFASSPAMASLTAEYPFCAISFGSASVALSVATESRIPAVKIKNQVRIVNLLCDATQFRKTEQPTQYTSDEVRKKPTNRVSTNVVLVIRAAGRRKDVATAEGAC